MENLVFALLTLILEWSPRLFFFVLEKLTSIGAPGIMFVRRLDQPTDVTFKCKIFVYITNQRPGQSVRLAAAYFVFNKTSPLRSDSKLWREYKTGRFHLGFPSPETKMHDWPDVYLRSGKTTNIWIGIDPEHLDKDIDEALRAENIGRPYFQMTRWTDSGSSKTRWVRFNL
jgi:hypothetical protein